MTTCAQWYALAMVGRKRAPASTKAPSIPEDHPGRADLNEVVAYNFRAARELRGWTQEETAEALEPLLGQRLPQASISAIERAYEGDRRREFDAQEILAFSLAFDLPLIWFFLPPPADHRTLHRTTNIVSELYEIVFGQERQLGPVYDRLRQLGIDEPTEAARTVEAITGNPSPARQASYRERRKQMLLALLDQYGDRVDQSAEEIGAFFDHLRQVGVRGLVAEQLNDADYVYQPEPAKKSPEPESTRHRDDGAPRLR
jgi:transcriptional regulator with XRE-family HTH domain